MSYTCISFVLTVLQIIMYMKMGGFNIPYIQGDIEYGVPVLIILGSIFTSWAYSLLSLAIVWVLHWRVDPIMYIPLANTIIILTISTSLALFFGIKNKNAKLIRSWYMAKVFECICTIVQVLLFLCTFNSFWPMAFFGIFMLPCGLYLIACVRKIYDDVTNQSATDDVCSEKITEKPVIQQI